MTYIRYSSEERNLFNKVGKNAVTLPALYIIDISSNDSDTSSISD